jgi:hypothetical protein
MINLGTAVEIQGLVVDSVLKVLRLRKGKEWEAR